MKLERKDLLGLEELSREEIEQRLEVGDEGGHVGVAVAGELLHHALDDMADPLGHVAAVLARRLDESSEPIVVSFDRGEGVGKPARKNLNKSGTYKIAIDTDTNYLDLFATETS